MSLITTTTATTTATVYLILELSSSALTPTSPPRKPWRQQFDTYPTGLPPFYHEDTPNHRYATTHASLCGRESWTIKIEYARNGHDSVDIVGCEQKKDGAERVLDGCVGVGEDGDRSEIGRRKKGVKRMFDEEGWVVGCEFHTAVPTGNVRDEVRWYWYDVLPVQLSSMKTYGISDPERERWRVEDMEKRVQEGLEMCRKTRGGCTRGEVKRMNG
jgi:hypothetical protein